MSDAERTRRPAAWRGATGSVGPNLTGRTVSDGSFSISRFVSPEGGIDHVVSDARSLRTDATLRLSGTT